MIIEKYAHNLIDRFKERNVDVKCQIIESMNTLILGHIEDKPIVSLDLELRNQASLKVTNSH